MTKPEPHLPRDFIDPAPISAKLPGWLKPIPFGDDGWNFENPVGQRRIFVTLDEESDPDNWWIHASVAYYMEQRIPSYSDLKQMHAAVFGANGFAYQCFVPPSQHINIRSNALHLWGRYDGINALPDFGRMGTI